LVICWFYTLAESETYTPAQFDFLVFLKKNDDNFLMMEDKRTSGSEIRGVRVRDLAVFRELRTKVKATDETQRSTRDSSRDESREVTAT